MTVGWVPVPDGSDFPLENLPFGVVVFGAGSPPSFRDLRNRASPPTVRMRMQSSSNRLMGLMTKRRFMSTPATRATSDPHASSQPTGFFEL